MWRVVHDSRVAIRAAPALDARLLGARQPGARVCVAFQQLEWVCLHADEGFGEQSAWMLVDGGAKGLGQLLSRDEPDRAQTVGEQVVVTIRSLSTLHYVEVQVQKD